MLAKYLCLLFAILLLQACTTTQPTLTSSSGQIVYVSDRDGKMLLYLMNADGSEQVSLPNDFADSYFAPAWSPDGKRVAFDCYFKNLYKNSSGTEICMMNTDGSDPIRLNESGGDGTQPSWSPDGMRIAFATTRQGYR